MNNKVNCEYCKQKINTGFTIYKTDNCEVDYIRICDHCYKNSNNKRLKEK